MSELSKRGAERSCWTCKGATVPTSQVERLPRMDLTLQNDLGCE
jgi:hypothetical protein